MNLSEALKAKISAAIERSVAPTEDPSLKKYKLSVTVTPGAVGYTNPRVTACIDALAEADVAYIKLIPMTSDGLLIIVPAGKDEKGALEFVRGGSRRTATFYMRAALLDFGITLSEKRKLQLPVIPDEAPTQDGKAKFVALSVKRPGSKKTTTRPRRNAAAKAGQPPAASAQPNK